MTPQAWPERPWPAAVPRFSTPRNPARDTLGHELVKVSRALGYEPMPWQRDLWDVQYELDDRGRLWYREARITVPRQSAKTTSTLVRLIDRCMHSEERGWGRRPVCLFTMQHASDARSKVVEDFMPDVEASAEVMAQGVTFHRSNGREGFSFANGARIKTFPPNLKGGHGGTVDQVDIDEAFAFADNRAEQGARPAMITRPSPQIVIQSTAGTAESTYLWGKVEHGRKITEAQRAGEDSHVMYVEYSIDPAVHDINNPEHWPLWMPALGYTIELDAIKMERDAMEPEEFFRAYGNGWMRSKSLIIPAERWMAAYSERAEREGSAWMSVDASPGEGGQGRSASISVAYWVGDDVHTAVIAHAPGISWVPEKIYELTRGRGVLELWVDPTGPIGAIMPDIRRKAMATVVESDARVMVNACARFHQGVLDGTTRHHNQDVLNAAVDGADKRQLEDGWAWKRRTSTEDISPLVACTLASWGAIVGRDQGLIAMHTGGAH